MIWLVGGSLLVLAYGCSAGDQEAQEQYAPEIDAAHFVATVDSPFFPYFLAVEVGNTEVLFERD